jgi:hypothetical protein
MDISSPRKSPVLLIVLQILCVLMTLNVIFSFVMSLYKPITQFNKPYVAFSVSVVWIILCAGFLLKKRWGWLMFLGAVYFILLNNFNILVGIRIDITLFHFIAPLVGIVIIILMNSGGIVEVYDIASGADARLRARSANFAVFCMFCGLFLLTEPFTENILSTSDLMAKAYVILLGAIFGLSGTGLWFENRLAVKSIQPLLLFVLLSSGYILVRDWFSLNRFYKPEQIVFYILFSLIILLYWSVFLRTPLLRSKT